MYVLVYFVSLTYNMYVHIINARLIVWWCIRCTCFIVDRHVLLGVLIHKICTNYTMQKFVCVWYKHYMHIHTCTVFPFYRWALTVWQMFTVYSLLMSVYRIRRNFREFHKSTGIHENENVKICTYTVQVCSCRPPFAKLKIAKIVRRPKYTSHENLYAYGSSACCWYLHCTYLLPVHIVSMLMYHPFLSGVSGMKKSGKK